MVDNLMIELNNINIDTITISVKGVQENRNISTSTRGLNGDNRWLGFSYTENGTTYLYQFAIWGGLLHQQLWQSYLNSVLNLSQVQAEATSRSLSTISKTQAQLATDIIHYECTQHGSEFLL